MKCTGVTEEDDKNPEHAERRPKIDDVPTRMRLRQPRSTSQERKKWADVSMNMEKFWNI